MMRRVFDWFRYALPKGVVNFWRFRREVWHFRPWDYEYSYTLFLRALELQDLYEHDANELRQALAIWREYLHGGMKRFSLGEMSASEADHYEQQRWDAFHDYLRDHARGWWA